MHVLLSKSSRQILLTFVYFALSNNNLRKSFNLVNVYLQISCILMEGIPSKNSKRDDQLNPKILTIINFSKWSRRSAILNLTFQNFPRNKRSASVYQVSTLVWIRHAFRNLTVLDWILNIPLNSNNIQQSWILNTYPIVVSIIYLSTCRTL